MKIHDVHSSISEWHVQAVREKYMKFKVRSGLGFLAVKVTRIHVLRVLLTIQSRSVRVTKALNA